MIPEMCQVSDVFKVIFGASSHPDLWQGENAGQVQPPEPKGGGGGGGDGSPDFLSDFSALDWEWETGSGQEEQLIEEGETLRNRAGFVHFEQSIIKKVNSWPGIEMAKLK